MANTQPAVLDDLDREVLNAVQWDFPLEPRPFAVLAERLGLDEPTVRARVRKVKEADVLRQLSAINETLALEPETILPPLEARMPSEPAPAPGAPVIVIGPPPDEI